MVRQCAGLCKLLRAPSVIDSPTISFAGKSESRRNLFNGSLDTGSMGLVTDPGFRATVCAEHTCSSDGSRGPRAPCKAHVWALGL